MSQPFRHRLRVRYSECDAQGVVFNANYVAYFDVAMTELWRETGRTYQEILESGTDMVVAEVRVRYLAPARFDDLIEIFIRLKRIGRTSATYECAAYRADDDVLMVTAEQTLVLVDLDERRARTIPEWYRETIRDFEGSDCETAPG